MAIGAILITAGCGSTPATLCGGIAVAQRMIASLQKSGAAMIVVVTGPEDKKLEKQLTRPVMDFAIARGKPVLDRIKTGATENSTPGNADAVPGVFCTDCFLRKKDCSGTTICIYSDCAL